MVRRLTVAILGVLACSCGANPTSPAATTLSALQIGMTNLSTGERLNESGIFYWTGPPSPPPQIQLRVLAKYDDGHQVDVTKDTTWQSSNASVATVSASGAVTVVALGQVAFTATYHGVVGITGVTMTSDPSELYD